MTVLTTARLRLREFTRDDAAFVLAIVNEPGWLRWIGDRNVRSLADAVGYLETGPFASYRANGFGLWVMEERHGGMAVGICGLLRRPTLPEVDVGYAVLERFSGRGYAREAAAAVLAFGRERHGLRRILAIVMPGNEASVRVATAIGMQAAGRVRLAADGPESLLFEWDRG